MTSDQALKVKRLQDNLHVIRLLIGWTATDLGKMLDVTKQTIYNLERGKPKMSLIQYLAIRTLIDEEIIRQKENDTLRIAVPVLLDEEDMPEDKRYELEESLKVITNGIKEKNDRARALSLAFSTISAVTTAAGIVVARAVGVSATPVLEESIRGIGSWVKIVKSIKED